MSNVWLVLPARRDWHKSSIPAWVEAGYNIAYAREIELSFLPLASYHINLELSHYPGWARCVNVLSQMVFLRDPQCNWVVACGDDQYPDPNKTPQEIAEECEDHFARVLPSECSYGGYLPTFGVMQPIGDPQRDSLGHIAPRVAGSPWIGREFAMRMYHGGGPLYPGYHHNHADQELKDVAEMLGCWWTRPDLTHRHDHWAYKRGSREDMPAWAAPLHTPEAWRKSNGLYQRRKATGFPGYEPLEENNGTENTQAKND